jgi:glycosyltransferase involved in cell wall biosynthesis
MSELYKEGWPRNVTLIPVVKPPLRILTPIVVSIIITPLIWIIDRLNPFGLIYVRSSPLALGPLTIKSLSKKTCVKLPAIAEDEMTRWKKISSLLFAFTDRFAIARARVVGVPSPVSLKNIALRRGILPRRIVLIPPGVDRQKIRITKGTSSPRKNAHIIGFLGSLAWWQGADVLVKAVAKLKDMLDKPVTLLIVGDGPERRKIEELCRQLGVNCCITGFVRHEEALRYLMGFDVLVVPSIRTSTTESNVPIKVIEAWALGVPVITTKHEVYEYMGLKDGEDIVYCDPDPNDLANKILAVLKNEGLRKRLSERGSLLAKNFYYDDIALRLLEALREPHNGLRATGLDRLKMTSRELLMT